MSPYAWLAILLVVSSMFGSTYFKGRTDGKAVVQEQWDAEKASAIIEAEKVRASNQSAIHAAEKKFATRAAKSRIVTRTIIEKVDHYVPNNTPLLPGGWRLLHDAAATGTEVIDPSGVATAPVAAATASRSVANNYAECREDKARLEALQTIIKSINGDEP